MNYMIRRRQALFTLLFIIFLKKHNILVLNVSYDLDNFK